MKRLLAALLAAGVLFALSACSSDSGNDASEANASAEVSAEVTQQAFDLDTYKMEAAACGRSIYDQGLILGNILNWEGNYIKTIAQMGGSANDSSDTLKRACESMQENYDSGKLSDEKFNNVNETTLKISYDEIAEQYMAVAEIETDSAVANDIRQQLKSMYEAYVTMYGGATTPTSSSVVSGLQELNTISETARMLTTLTGETVETDEAE